MKHYFKQHPACEFPSDLIAEGMEDTSYHNDTCGKAQLFLIPDNYEVDVITVWCAEEQADKREYPDEPRYTVDINLTEDDHCSGSGFVLKTNDIRRVLDIVRGAKAAWVESGHPGLTAYRNYWSK